MLFAWSPQQACGTSDFEKAGWHAIVDRHKGEVGISCSSKPGSQEHPCSPACEVLEQRMSCPTWSSS